MATSLCSSTPAAVAGDVRPATNDDGEAPPPAPPSPLASGVANTPAICDAEVLEVPMAWDRRRARSDGGGGDRPRLYESRR